MTQRSVKGRKIISRGDSHNTLHQSIYALLGSSVGIVTIIISIWSRTPGLVWTAGRVMDHKTHRRASS